MDLRNEDCVKGIKNLENKSVDLIFCDLPYGCTNCPWDEKLDLKKLSEELLRVAKDKCTIVFTCKFKFGLEIIEAMGKKYFRYDMVWKKSRPSGFLHSNKKPMSYHENILIFYKKCPSDIYKKNKNKYHIKSGKNTGKDTISKVYKKKCIRTSEYIPRLPSTILDIPHHNRALINSTQKPIELIEFFIKYYTDEDAIILDPTFGSCSTGIACLNLNRNFIGFEKNPEQYNTAISRLNEYKKETAKAV